MYRYLLFDIDDTLLDFKTAQIRSFQQLLDHYHIPFSHDLYHTYQTINLAMWHAYEKGERTKKDILSARFEQFFDTLDLPVNGEFCDTFYRDKLASGDQLFPNTLPVIKHFSNTHQLAIVTNGVAQTQLARLHNNQLFNYFNPYIFISDTIGFQKPDPRFFEYVFQHMGIQNPQDVLIIGDSLHADVYGGSTVSIDTCWIKHSESLQHDDVVTPTYTITDLSELLSLNI